MTRPAPFTNSYMELCFHTDGGPDLYLRVPTVWDDINKQWLGFVKTPKTQRLIHGQGKDSLELQNSFNRALNLVFTENEEEANELFSMFQPLSYWEEMTHTSNQE